MPRRIAGQAALRAREIPDLVRPAARRRQILMTRFNPALVQAAPLQCLHSAPLTSTD